MMVTMPATPGDVHPAEAQGSTRPFIDDALVRRLVETQFPAWADLPLTRVEPAGSDHALFRLGDDLSVRVPVHAGAMAQARKNAFWLPRLAPHLPLPIPVPVAVGEPAFGYPWPWAICRWLDGEVATVDALADSAQAAVDLATFLLALQRFDPGEVAQERAAELRLGPLSTRDAYTRAAIREVEGVFDGAALSDIWDAALRAPEWEREPVWFHGDFHTGNLLMSGGRVTAVIDFGCLGLGDPACDLMVAYTLNAAAARDLPGCSRSRRRHVGPRSGLGTVRRPQRLYVLR